MMRLDQYLDAIDAALATHGLALNYARCSSEQAIYLTNCRRAGCDPREVARTVAKHWRGTSPLVVLPTNPRGPWLDPHGEGDGESAA